jgi:thioredoxin-like negative regulator of GroEL
LAYDEAVRYHRDSVNIDGVSELYQSTVPPAYMTELSIQQLSEAAMQSHRAGDAAKAEALCNQALSRQPECGDALHLLGLISSERGQQENARDLLERAIEPISASSSKPSAVPTKLPGLIDWRWKSDPI